MGSMRGTPERQLSMLSSLSTDDLIPVEHPIRRIRLVVDEVLGGMDGVFESMYSTKGRPSVPPEMLLKATVLTAMYSMRSEGRLRAPQLRHVVEMVPRSADRRPIL